MTRSFILRATACCLVLTAAAAPAWFASARLTAARQSAPAPRASEPTAEQYAYATRSVRGALTSAARAAVATRSVSGRAVIVVVRGRDFLVCEDLGRQLREIMHRPGNRSVVILTDSADVTTVTTFLRREHVHAPVSPVGLRSTFVAQPNPYTPAVLVTRDGGNAVEGVAHPRRFPNVRVRSFAEELGVLLD